MREENFKTLKGASYSSMKYRQHLVVFFVLFVLFFFFLGGGGGGGGGGGELMFVGNSCSLKCLE